MIVFSSGAIVNATVRASPPTVMGFGNNQVVTPVSSPVQFGQYAFPVPLDGVIYDLSGSIDSHFAPATAQVPWTYIWTVYVSPSSGSGSPDVPTINYVSTGLTTSVTLPQTTTSTFSAPGEYVSGSNLTLGPVSVNAGDRLVMVLTSDQPGTPPAVDFIGFGASLFYAPNP
jgi:hypothetical protein